MDIIYLWSAALTLLLAWGAISDIKWRRLPNWLSALLLILGLGYAIWSGGLDTLGWHAAHSIIALAVGMALFAAGIFGGGDIKFYAGMAAFFPLNLGLILLLYVVLIGGLLALCWIIGRRILPGLRKLTAGVYGELPYGVAIAAGGIALAWNTQIAT